MPIQSSVNINISLNDINNIFSNIQILFQYNEFLLKHLEEEEKMNESQLGKSFVILVNNFFYKNFF